MGINNPTAPASATKLDDLTAPDDNTDLNASTTAHGLLPKLSNVATEFLNGVGAFSTPAAKVTLLKAGSGTTTNASAENVDTIAISGLTAKDSLYVVVTLESVTQQTSVPQLYNATDSVQIGTWSDGGTTSVAAGEKKVGTSVVAQMQAAATQILVLNTGAAVVSGTHSAYASQPTFTTAWTGAWTLALRHNGVIAGGTFKWTWAVYKIAGQ